MPLGMKMAPLIPRVPAVVTCGCWMYLWHVWIALMYFFGLGSATDPDQLTASIYIFLPSSSILCFALPYPIGVGCYLQLVGTSPASAATCVAC